MHRAYALPLVLGLLLLLSAALATAMMGINASQFVGESTIHRRQAFHNAEGVSVAVAELASTKLRSLPMQPELPVDDPGFKQALKDMLADQQEQANTFIEEQRDSFTTPGYTLERAQISNLGPAQLRLLASGAFQGMQAQVQSFNVDVVVQRAHSRTPGRQGIVASVERATMSMFQFYVFADGYLDLDPGGPVDTVGRIHANGDFCIAGQPRVDTVTSAERILVSNNPNGHNLCRRRAGDGGTIKVLTSYLPPTLATWPNDFDHSSPNWKSQAIAKFNGHLRDKAHDVAPLKMPLSGKPIVQAGASVLAMERVSGSGPDDRLVPIGEAKEDNTSSMRFLVDPMLVSEPEDVRRQKFAFKADLRIIDGVWYLRDPDAPEEPGMPIWSDHPGAGDIDIDDTFGDASIATTMITETNNVGQEDLRTARGWGANTPKQFSYYGFRRASDGTLTWARTPGALTTTTRAVISYGLLAPAGGSVWNPGAYNAASAPTSLTAASTLAELLRGTQHGFKNGWLEVRSEERAPVDGDGVSAAERGRSRTLSVNFDIAGLTAALRNCVAGELGSYFPGTCFGNDSRRFNGIVYISSTWPGALNGLGDAPGTSTFPILAPFNAAGGNATLPTSMCAAASSTIPLTPTPHVTQLCSTTKRITGGFPSVVRVFNGKHVSPASAKNYAGVDIPARFYPRGLSIITNLPVIALGDINVDTTPLDTPESLLAGTDYFVPVLIGGDRFHRHSVSWSDARANWQQGMDENARDGHETRQYIEILAGWNPTPTNDKAGHDHSSDGFEDFPRYNECWSGKAVYRGSIVVAFSSVFERAGANNADGHPGGGGYLTCFPGRDEGFDFHLQDPLNQPPGAPMIVAQSIGFWRAQ